MRKYILLSLLIFTCGLSVIAQRLGSTERKIMKTVEKNNREAIEFLENVVNINSGTLNLNGVREVGTVFSDAFTSIGFQTSWKEMPEEMNRAGHLFAETSGSKGVKLLLIGHLDTVFEN
ncbi:MAG: M20 family peptidase, partial [Flavobacteriaceae bacterium]